MRVIVPVFLCLLLFGCLPARHAPYKVDLYTLDYPPPVVAGTRLAEAVRIDRFSVAQAYNSDAMVYRPGKYRLAVYQYHRWRVNPGDMVTDYLVRDFRSSGLFAAVFSWRDRQTARFEVEGGVESFVESREGGARTAVLVLQVALLDRSEPSVAARVLFQRQYRDEEPLSAEGPSAFAAGMSAAMARLSARIIGDVDAAGRMRTISRPAG